MPTSRKRHMVTETDKVGAALDRVRQADPDGAVSLGELVLLGAACKVELLEQAVERIGSGRSCASASSDAPARGTASIGTSYLTCASAAGHTPGMPDGYGGRSCWITPRGHALDSAD